VAAWLAFAAYLLTPTSLRGFLDGVPLNTRAELAGFVLVSVAAGAAALAWALGLCDDPAPPVAPGPRRRLIHVAPLAIAVMLLAGLSVLKVGFPPRDPP
jgi:hypothetical protein